MKKIVVRAYLRQKWINLRQTQTTTISGPLYGYRRIHFTSGNAVFYIYLSIGLSVCLSVTYLLFTRYWNVIESYIFQGSYPLHY